MAHGRLPSPARTTFISTKKISVFFVCFRFPILITTKFFEGGRVFATNSMFLIPTWNLMVYTFDLSKLDFLMEQNSCWEYLVYDIGLQRYAIRSSDSISFFKPQFWQLKKIARKVVLNLILSIFIGGKYLRQFSFRETFFES